MNDMTFAQDNLMAFTERINRTSLPHAYTDKLDQMIARFNNSVSFLDQRSVVVQLFTRSLVNLLNMDVFGPFYYVILVEKHFTEPQKNNHLIYYYNNHEQGWVLWDADDDPIDVQIQLMEEADFLDAADER